MKLTKQQEKAITAEFEKFRDRMYEGLSDKGREELGQFFTPSDLTIKILKALDCTFEEFLESEVIDPTSGSGNLLAAALILGVPANHIFGNEYDTTMVKLCRERLQAINPDVANWQIHKGDANDSFCLNYFGEDYPVKLRAHYLDEVLGDYAMSIVPIDLSAEQEAFLAEVD